MELAILKCLASVKVQDRHGPVVQERGGILVTGSRRWSNNISSWYLGTVAGIYRHRRRMAVPGASMADNGLR